MKLDHFVQQSGALIAINLAIQAMPATPPLPVAQAVARDCVKRIALEKLREYVRADVQELLDQQVMFNGEPDPDPVEKWRAFQWDAWEVGQDDAIETYFDGLPRELLSSNFTGTIGTAPLRRAADVEKICERFADEAWRNLTYHHNKDDEDTFGKEKTAGQILSSVGVTTPDIEAMIAEHIPTEETATKKDEVIMFDKAELLGEIRDNASMLGLLDDHKQLRNAIDNAVDDDDGLAASGFDALGLDYTDDRRLTMQTMNMTFGVEGILNVVLKAGEDEPTVVAPVYGVATIPAAAASGTIAVQGSAVETVSEPPPAKPARAKKADPAPGVAEPGRIPPFVLVALKDKTGMKAEDVATKLGTARTTFLNYCSGKAALYANDSNRAIINELLDAQIATLTAAREQMNAV